MHKNRHSTGFRRWNGASSNKGGHKNTGRSSGRGGFGAQRQNPYKDGFISQEMFISKAIDFEQEAIYDESVSFTDFGLLPKLVENIRNRNYKQVTKIQAQVIKPILEKKDVLGLASTGSGKTAAFLIPMIDASLRDSKKRSLIVAPTRELVNQIQTEFRSFAQNTFLIDVLIVGGASYSTQIRVLRKNPQFVIATPGRLLDLYKNNQIDLGSFDTVVLDEVDRMLDMGFINDIKLIVSKLKNPRQSMFFSATLSPKLKDIATSLLLNPVEIEVSKQSAIKNVDQDIVKVGSSANKLEVLHNLLVNTDFRRVLIFSRTKHGADRVADALRKKGHRCDSLHSNKTLNKRTKILAMFKRDEIDILVATDVASRGIDVPDITHVINYDRPATYDDYIHRIGRTGRIGKKGTALTFV